MFRPAFDADFRADSIDFASAALSRRARFLSVTSKAILLRSVPPRAGARTDRPGAARGGGPVPKARSLSRLRGRGRARAGALTIAEIRGLLGSHSFYILPLSSQITRDL